MGHVSNRFDKWLLQVSQCRLKPRSLHAIHVFIVIVYRVLEWVSMSLFSSDNTNSNYTWYSKASQSVKFLQLCLLNIIFIVIPIFLEYVHEFDLPIIHIFN